MKLERDAPPQGTLRDWVDSRAEAGGTAFVFPETGETLDWPALRDSARRIAGSLAGQGAQKGESVAIVMPNGRAAIEALYGTLYGGFRLTMINLAPRSRWCVLPASSSSCSPLPPPTPQTHFSPVMLVAGERVREKRH